MRATHLQPGITAAQAPIPGTPAAPEASRPKATFGESMASAGVVIAQRHPATASAIAPRKDRPAFACQQSGTPTVEPKLPLGAATKGLPVETKATSPTVETAPITAAPTATSIAVNDPSPTPPRRMWAPLANDAVTSPKSDSVHAHGKSAALTPAAPAPAPRTAAQVKQPALQQVPLTTIESVAHTPVSAAASAPQAPAVAPKTQAPVGQAFTAELPPLSTPIGEPVTQSQTPAQPALHTAIKPSEPKPKHLTLTDAPASDASPAPTPSAAQPTLIAVDLSTAPIAPTPQAPATTPAATTTAPVSAASAPRKSIALAQKADHATAQTSPAVAPSTAPQPAPADQPAPIPVAPHAPTAMPPPMTTVAPIVTQIATPIQPTHAGTPSTTASLGTPTAEPTEHAQPGDTRTLAATPNILEVGIPSETHGWLRVRAELNHTGEVTASVATTSTSAAQSLHKDLPAMTAFLSTEQVGIASVTVNAPAHAAAVPDLTAGTGGTMAEGQRRESSGQPAQHSSDDRGSSAFNAAPWLSDDTGLSSPVLHAGSGLNGGWVSVRV